MSTIILKDNGERLKESFEEIFEKFNFFQKGRIFIKPNFSGRPPIIPGENTDPKVLKELVELLLYRGAKEILVGHGALLGTPEKQFPLDEIIVNGGFSFLKTTPKTKIINIDEVPHDLVNSVGFKFHIPKILREVDGYINLAKLKTHMETKVTFSLKNQMGLVSAADRVNMHRDDLEKDISCLARAIKPTISIVDGITAMEGDGPHNGDSRKLGLLVAGDDMVELDSTVSFLIGLDFRKIKHISYAKELGAGSYPSNEYLASIKKYRVPDFKLARKNKKFMKNIYVWPTRACSRCITVLNEYGANVKKHPIKNYTFLKKAILGNKKINIIIGKVDNLKAIGGGKNIAIGYCTREFAKKHKINNLDKCPPSVKEVLEYIKKEISY